MKMTHTFIFLLFHFKQTYPMLKGQNYRLVTSILVLNPRLTVLLEKAKAPCPKRLRVLLPHSSVFNWSTTPPSIWHLFDGGMKLIMDSSKRAHINTTNMVSKANTAFASHFIEQLSMALWFNDFENHSCPKKEYMLSTPDHIAAGICHNQKILLYYLSRINESHFSKLFPKGHNKSVETQVHKVVRA